MSEKEEIVADREIEIPGMEDVAIEPETNVVVMNPDNNQNEVGRQKELTDGVRKQQIDLEGIGTSEIHNLSDTNVARVGESRTDITDKSEFVETRETEPVDKAGWIVRRISELGGYENVSDYVKTDVADHKDGFFPDVNADGTYPVFKVVTKEYDAFYMRQAQAKGKALEEIEIISGSNLTLDDTLYKHLLRSFLYLKEAMFSRCIVFVEGDTENGAMPVFAKRMDFDFDEKGIGVVKLDGADSVENCMKLYNEFKIKAIAIIDKDKKDKYNHMADVFFTKGNDFEEDVYDNFTLMDYMKYNNYIGKINAFIRILRPYGVVLNIPSYIEDPDRFTIDDNLQQQIIHDIKDNELVELRKTKNASKASLLAECVTTVPGSFQKVIKKLKKEVK